MSILPSIRTSQIAYIDAFLAINLKRQITVKQTHISEKEKEYQYVGSKILVKLNKYLKIISYQYRVVQMTPSSAPLILYTIITYMSDYFLFSIWFWDGNVAHLKCAHRSVVCCRKLEIFSAINIKVTFCNYLLHIL